MYPKWKLSLKFMKGCFWKILFIENLAIDVSAVLWVIIVNSYKIFFVNELDKSVAALPLYKHPRTFLKQIQKSAIQIYFQLKKIGKT